MSAQRSLLAGALCLVGMGLAGPASAKIYLDGEWIVDGHAKHEIRTTFSGTCSADQLAFGTNDGMIQVDKLKDFDEIHGFISQQVNWKCGNGGYSPKKCPGSDRMWVSLKLGDFFVLFCLGGKIVGN